MAGKGKLPYLHGQRLIHFIGKARRRGPRLPVIDCERAATMEIMRAGRWARRSIYAVQGL